MIVKPATKQIIKNMKSHGYIYCNQCSKKIEDEKLAWFGDREKDLDFCLEDCFSKSYPNWKEWKNIHSGFTPRLMQEWESRNFSYEQGQEWIKQGLNPNEFIFATLKNEPEQENLNLDEWRIKWAESSEKSQKWLDRHYPKEERSETREIYLNEPSLEGKLDLGDFAYEWGLKIYISTQVDETELVIENLPIRVEISRNSWADIHKDFEWEWEKTNWQELGLDYQKTKEWINSGFKPRDYSQVRWWQNYGFTCQDAEQWMTIGLKAHNYDLVAYARYKDYSPDTVNREALEQELKEWKENPKRAQEYLDCFYPQKERAKTTELRISKNNLTRTLDLNEFVNLEELDCSNNNLDKLILVNCSNLKKLVCYSNQLTNLDINNCLNLKELTCSSNQLNNLDLTNLENLEEINCGNNQLTGLDVNHCLNLKKIGCSSNQLNNLSFPDFYPNLNELDCSHNKLTSLTVNGCSNLMRVECNENLLTKLDLVKNKELEELNAGSNQLTELDFGSDQNNKLKKMDVTANKFSEQNLSFLSNLVKLKELDLAVNGFIGSLEPLKNMTKLRSFNIMGTELDSGLEHLPNKIKKFMYYEDYKEKIKELFKEVEVKNYKCDNIFNIFADEQGKIETSFSSWGDEPIKDFSEKLQVYKKLASLEQFRSISDSDWAEIHQVFAEGKEWGKILKQKLEEKGLDEEKQEELIKAFIELKLPKELISCWENGGKFTAQQIREWLTTGLLGWEAELVAYLQKKNLTPSQVKGNLEKLREEYNSHLLSELYPLEERDTTESISIGESNFLKGTLIIQDFPQLKKISIESSWGLTNQLDSLVILNCPQLEELNCRRSRLTNLEISPCPNLLEIYCPENKLADLKFLDKINAEKLNRLDISKNEFQQDLSFLRKFINLESLDISNNGFHGSLEPLKNLVKLNYLFIDNTNLESGLEYLSENLERFRCAGQLSDILKPYIQEENSDNYYEKELKAWREKNRELIAKVQIGQSRDFQVEELKNQLSELNDLIFSSQNYEFAALKEEIKRLKIQDLNIQIPAKKKELEQLIDSVKEKLDKAEKYLLEKLLKKHNKIAQSGIDSSSEKLEELKESLNEKLNEGEVKSFLDKQKEIIELEKKLESLQEQQTNIEIPPK